jgi:hypothetical protein
MPDSLPAIMILKPDLGCELRNIISLFPDQIGHFPVSGYCHNLAMCR